MHQCHGFPPELRVVQHVNADEDSRQTVDASYLGSQSLQLPGTKHFFALVTNFYHFLKLNAFYLITLT